jgi:hypothetical protein
MIRSPHPRRRSGRLVAAVVALAAAALAVGVPTATPGATPTASAQASELAAGGEYHPLTPTRIFDSRNAINDTAPLGIKPTSPGGNAFNVSLLGKGGIPAPAGDVLAVVLNVTVNEPGLGGYLSIRPNGSPAAVSSLINFEAGKSVPNMAVVGVGNGGMASITLTTPQGASRAHVLVDVFGWISTSGYNDASDSGSRIIPVAPTRILDTRSAPTPNGWPGGQPMGEQQQLKLPVRGAQGVPNDPNITGVVVNITGNNVGGGFTYLSASPNPFSGPEATTSNTNLGGGQTKANTAIVPINADGTISIFNRFSATHVIVDVLGYLQRGHSPTSTAGRVIPLDAPFRAFDTRQDAFGEVPLGLNATENWSFRAFADSVTLGNGDVGAQSGFIGNLTATDLNPSIPGQPVGTYLTAFPGNVAQPNSSHLNLVGGESVPNMALLKYGSANGDANTVRVFNYDGSVHYMLDVYAVILA